MNNKVKLTMQVVAFKIKFLKSKLFNYFKAFEYC